MGAELGDLLVFHLQLLLLRARHLLEARVPLLQRLALCAGLQA
jgi:hypothetical protein